MKIGITVDDSNLESLVSESFSGCKYLMIITIEDHLMGESPRIKETTVIDNQADHSEFNLVQELIHYDCEAVITGELEPDEFEFIADACITRYYGAGYQTLAALEKMEKRELSLIRNLDGTNGCDESHHMHQIIIIGTIPPCPRCKLLTETVTMKVKSLGLAANIRHISYTSQEAAELAGKVGLKPGTAKDVARITGQDINLEKMPKISDLPELGYLKNLESDLKQFESLFREVYLLDNWLRPFENQAKEVGILMTPVLIIDGEIRYNGSVPELALIDKCLSELK